MRQTMTKYLAMLFTVLLVFMNLSFIPVAEVGAASVDQAVTISVLDEEGNDVIDMSVVEFEEGATAEDVLVKIADKKDIELEVVEYSWGNMLIGIDNILSDDATFWSIIVNGVSADVGMSDYIVKHGDNLLLRLSGFDERTIDIKVSALDEAGKFVLEESTLVLNENATANDAIYQAAEGNVEVSVDTNYFTYISNILNHDISEKQFWSLLSNGEALQVGASTHKVVDGEHIQLKLEFFDDSVVEPEPEVGGNDDTVEPPVEDEIEVDTNDKKINEKAFSELAFLKEYYENNDLATEYWDEWGVWALATAGGEIPPSYKASIEKILEEDEEAFSDNIYDLEKVIIALSASGEDATNVAGFNLIEMLEEHSSLTGIINAAIYGLIAFNSGDYDVDSVLEDAVVDFIISEEVDGGGWAFFGDIASADITGMALIGLAPYQDRPEVKKAVNKAVEYLSGAQQENGGFDEAFVGDTAESVAQVIIGLISVGINPMSEQFLKSEGNLLEHLLTFKHDDGLYRNNITHDQSSLMTTEQVFLALAYYAEFMGVEPAPVPTPKPEKEPELETETEIEKEEVERVPEVTLSEDDIIEPVVEQTGKELPKTATQMYNYLVLGLLLLVISGITYIIQRKYRKQ